VVEADIEACFDQIDHAALMHRVRDRIKDKRVLALVKAFLHAGILTEHGGFERSLTGTPQGGILSPLLANIALSALDEHFDQAWQAMGANSGQRQTHRRRGGATYRLIRYADDFVIVVAGERRHAEALVVESGQVLAPLGLTLSQEKTRTTHIDEGIEFLGFRIQRKQGRHGHRYVYTYPSRPSLRAVMQRVREISREAHDHTLGQLLHRLNPVLRGWCGYFRHGTSKQTFNYLRAYTWRRVVQWLRRKHPKANWRWLRSHYLPGSWPTHDGVVLFNPGGMVVTRYRYRGEKIPVPWEGDGREAAVGLEQLQLLIAG
jgi:RNA-directed DNA polymerase